MFEQVVFTVNFFRASSVAVGRSRRCAVPSADLGQTLRVHGEKLVRKMIPRNLKSFLEIVVLIFR